MSKLYTLKNGKFYRRVPKFIWLHKKLNKLKVPIYRYINEKAHRFDYDINFSEAIIMYARVPISRQEKFWKFIYKITKNFLMPIYIPKKDIIVPPLGLSPNMSLYDKELAMGLIGYIPTQKLQYHHYSLYPQNEK